MGAASSADSVNAAVGFAPVRVLKCSADSIWELAMLITFTH